MFKAMMWLLLLPGLVAAQTIYKHVDEDGNVTYSDEPIENAEEIELAPLSVVEGRQRPVIEDSSGNGQPADEGEDEEAVVYTRFEITAPRSEETFWGPNASIYGVLRISPTLAPSHSIRYFLDGQKIAETRSIRVQLQDVVRGAHQFSAQIVDAEGNAQATAEPVTFYLQQPSVIPPANPAPGIGGG
ncbi:MAG: DUF4124 domain-containing protein [Xanthomonadales bacterium]|nr:DUF4124 domain-containing protein [Xanthomonadales bacterium]